MPCFDGLFEEDTLNDAIQDVVFSMAAFHGFAKLHMHTDSSLSCYDGLTTVLGKDARYFADDVCEQLPAIPLAREVAARRRRQHRKAQQARSASPRNHSRSQTPSRSTSPSPSRKRKYFNMYTYKWHNLGHYPDIIRKYGTLDLLGTPKVRSLLLCMLHPTIIVLGRNRT